MAKNILIPKYQKQFKRFVDSIDLEKPQSEWNHNITGVRRIKKKWNVNMKIVDISVMNKINHGWKIEKVIDIIVYITIRFVVITLIRYMLHY